MWALAHHLSICADNYQEIAVRLVVKEGLPKDDAVVQHWIRQAEIVQQMSSVIANGIHFEAENDYNHFQHHHHFTLKVTTEATQ